VIRHSLADAIFWIAAISCLGAQVAILRSALVAPMTEPSGERSGLPHPRRVIEVAWTIVPAIALAALLFATWTAIHAGRGNHDPRFASAVTSVR
jgi:heme/copper-type cytochrome/quinol oxidase subunit 2